MGLSDDICLLVRRAGHTEIFPLPGHTIRFGYAPGGPDDLVLYDCLLKDIQGMLVYEAPETQAAANGAEAQGGLTAYALRANAKGILLDGTELPPRQGVSVRLRLGQEIKVGEQYHLIVASYQPAERTVSSLHMPTPRTAIGAARPLPGELEDFFAISRFLLAFLPEIYQKSVFEENEMQPFLARFLALFETVFLPLKWTVENFALYLHPDSAPPEMLPWLAGWYGIPFDQALLAEPAQRAILRNMPGLLARLGTHGGLVELLWLYTGVVPVIIEDAKEQVDRRYAGPRHFCVQFTPPPEPGAETAQLRQLIDWYKPADTSFSLR